MPDPIIPPHDDEHWMRHALREAEQAFSADEVPIGAVIVANDRIIARGHNLTERLNDVTAHAEMQAITAAADHIGGKYLHDCTLYVTLEPCVMCAGALAWGHIGRIVFGAECRVVEPGTTEPVPWDGESSGELQCRGNWIASGYYNDERSGESFTADGWLMTGDVATVDSRGRVRLVDRTKDLIKSGGEWISSVELENELMGHPKIAEAAVIGVAHERWGEAPLACVVKVPGEELTEAEVLEFLDGKIAKWQMPKGVVWIDEVPKTSVGKFSKKDLRKQFEDYVIPGTED